jgi:hypothetical protein
VRRWRQAGIALALLVGLLLAVRALAPIAVQRYVNRTLDRAEGYEGHIGDVDLNLWRGAYEVEQVEIVKSGGRVPVPLLRAPLVDLSLEWGALFDGAIVGEIWFEQPELNFVAGPAAERQSGAEADWRTVVEDLLPVRINRVTVRDGTMHFRSFGADPPLDVYLQDVDLVVLNLTNSEDLSEDLVARARFEAVPMDRGRVRARMAIDPYAARPSFDLDCQISGVALTHLNDLFRAYAGIDVQRGRLDLVAELQAEDGSFRGYIKPFFADVDVLGREELDDQSWLASLWEALVGGTVELFEDQEQDRVATRIPIAGTVSSPDVGFWRTLGNVLRNAFLEAFVPSLEHSVGEDGRGSARG